MSNNKKTDNSNLDAKVQLRIKSFELLKKDTVNILDAFGGDGIVWKAVKDQLPKGQHLQLNVLRIDKQQKKGIYLKGDNMKYLKAFDLSGFDIIDLDAYGSPFNQLEVLFSRKFKGLVHCTYIQSGLGNINMKMLERLGYTERMVKKAQTLFTRQPFQKMLSYLSLNGIREITNYQVNDRKNYFYFLLEPAKK